MADGEAGDGPEVTAPSTGKDGAPDGSGEAAKQADGAVVHQWDPMLNPLPGDLPSDLPPEAQVLIRQSSVVHQEARFSPPPDELEAYAKLDPSYADRILSKWETQVDHVQYMGREGLAAVERDGERAFKLERSAIRGLTGILVGVLLLAAYALYLGDEVVAAILAGVSFAAGTATFLKRTGGRKVPEAEEEDSEAAGDAHGRTE